MDAWSLFQDGLLAVTVVIEVAIGVVEYLLYTHLVRLISLMEEEERREIERHKHPFLSLFRR